MAANVLAFLMYKVFITGMKFYLYSMEML